jgi:hypothetical protein
MHPRCFVRFCTLVLTLFVTLAAGAAMPAAAQTVTGTIRGIVRGEAGEALANATVVATHIATNAQRRTTTSERGLYQLVGLQPGEYEVRVQLLGLRQQTRTVRLQVGQTLDVGFELASAAVELEAVEVVGAPAVELRTVEAATNISQEQIESMPLNDRNFLSLAALAPGVTFGCAGNCPPGDGGGLNSGAESADNANVFVDGVSFKNDILRGGVAGQDASKGNPFPQVAVQEFRVITQQYKAEYQKATSAIVTATTRSGTNEFHGELFGFRQDERLIEPDFFTVQRCVADKAGDPTFECEDPKQGRWQMGGSVGGPIIRDKLFFFAAYEGNYQDRAFTVTPTNLEPWPADVQQELESHARTFPSEFRSNLYFGKLTYRPSERHRFELSGNVRDEFDIRNFGGFNSFENAEHFHNDVNTFLLRHQYNAGGLLNELQVSYQYYRWFPVQLNEDIIGREYEGSLKIGGRCCPQDRWQKRLSLSDDISYTLPGLAGDHVFKLGGNLDFVEYELFNPLQINPQFFYGVPTDPTDPVIPQRVSIGLGVPGKEPITNVTNKQLGLYVQDDWTVTPRLTLNLGVRWDFETNGLNNSYVTPPEVVAEVGARDDLILVNDNYFTDGDDRPAFKGAIQPRLGFSFDLTGRNETILFGGFGIYHDRNSFAMIAPEHQSLVWNVYNIQFSEDGSVPGTIAWDERYFSRDALEEVITSGAAGTTGLPEAFLLENNTKPPRSTQFSLGVRQAWRDLLFSVNYTGVRSQNHFTWMFANRDPANQLFGLPSYRNVLVSTDEGRSWYDAVYVKAEKRYSADSRWGGQIAYTLGWAEATIDAGRHFQGLSYRTPDEFDRRRSERDQRHAVTANWIVGLPLDIRFSGILTLASGRAYRVFYGGNACTTGNMDCFGNEYPGGDPSVPWGGTNPNTGEPQTDAFFGIPGWAFRNVDLRFEKAFEYRGHRIGLIAEGFNVFDFDNFVGYDGRIGNLKPPDDPDDPNGVEPNPSFGQKTGVINDTRLPGAPPRWQFGVRYGF